MAAEIQDEASLTMIVSNASWIVFIGLTSPARHPLPPLSPIPSPHIPLHHLHPIPLQELAWRVQEHEDKKLAKMRQKKEEQERRDAELGTYTCG